MGFLADGELLVVETADDHYVGTVEVLESQLIVRSGYVGRPVLLRPEQVIRIAPAAEHPLVDKDGLDARA